MEDSESRRERELIRVLVEGTAAEVGPSFFPALVRSAAEALGTFGAWVAEYFPEAHQLRAIAMKLGDEWIDDYTYAIEDTPCETAIAERAPLLVADHVFDAYPGDPQLEELSVVSYFGVPLLDPDGAVIGHLAALDTKPMGDDVAGRRAFTVLAARAAAELQRIRAERLGRARETQLARVLDGAMDAIVCLDPSLRIEVVNRAGAALLLPEHDPHGPPGVTGVDLLQLLDEVSAARLRETAARLSEPSSEDSVWIAGNLTISPSGGSPFQAEATLSRYLDGPRERFVLVLRDVNERLQAQERIRSLQRRTDLLREELDRLREFHEIVGESPPLVRALQEVRQVAEMDTTVLLLGETGTGKELFARAVHAHSGRAGQPLVTVNCAAIPADLIESELFGHVKGAFTGATVSRVGRFVLADGGTLFLDELGELPLEAQAKLLRALQEGEVQPVGSSKTQSVDVRIVAATNRDLAAEVGAGTFREDLYYRLNVFPVRIPPLRDRGDDVILLAERFLADLARRYGRRSLVLSDPCRQSLRQYRWPGNVRELQNVVERAVITAGDGQLDLVRALGGAGGLGDDGARERGPAVGEVLTTGMLRELERDNIILALERCGWRVSGEKGAAKVLEMNASTLASRIRALNIERPR